MAENWLYQKALDVINKEHDLNLNKLYNHRAKITLSKASQFGSDRIQIDIIAADTQKQILVFGEAKEFLTFQGISECAEQLVLKQYLLKKYHKKSRLGSRSNECIQILVDEINNYSVLNYVILGSYSGTKCYNNAKCNDVRCLEKRLKEYSHYLSNIGRCIIGIILFQSKSSDCYVIKQAVKIKYKG